MIPQTDNRLTTFQNPYYEKERHKNANGSVTLVGANIAGRRSQTAYFRDIQDLNKKSGQKLAKKLLADVVWFGFFGYYYKDVVVDVVDSHGVVVHKNDMTDKEIIDHRATGVIAKLTAGWFRDGTWVMLPNDFQKTMPNVSMP